MHSIFKPKNRNPASLGDKPKVFVALSGGVDSSVAAALLRARGFRVHGVHMKMWSEPGLPCRAKEDRYDAMRVAARLNIPFETWDFTKEYRAAVVEYMIREYAAGRTPNPDVMCNRKIKFGLFLQKALAAGANYIATGHYIQIQNSKCKIQNDNSKFKTTYKLFRAKDNNKDQSYFLWTLTQAQLAHCLFPIGEYAKPEVRTFARKFGLPTAEKPDSQGICFIGEIDVREFLTRYIPQRRGRVLTTSGRVIGSHPGTEFYTIGQRDGLGIGGGIPYYVAEKDAATNTLVVTEGPFDSKLFRKELNAEMSNWISGNEPKFPLRCEARIRYRQPVQRCTVRVARIDENGEAEQTDKRSDSSSGAIHRAERSNNLTVIFDESQRAITPGQSIVFYKSQEMLGGAIIS